MNVGTGKEVASQLPFLRHEGDYPCPQIEFCPIPYKTDGREHLGTEQSSPTLWPEKVGTHTIRIWIVCPGRRDRNSGQHHLPYRPHRGRDVHTKPPRASLVFTGANGHDTARITHEIPHRDFRCELFGMGRRIRRRCRRRGVVVVLLTFGTAIGLSATPPWPGSGLSAWAAHLEAQLNSAISEY
jgi:hypothetical protein